MVTLYTITLTVACCAAVAVAFSSVHPRGSDQSSWASPSVLAILSACCATLSTLAYAMAGSGASLNLVALVIGDVTMPLAVGLITAAMRRAAGRRHTFLLLLALLSAGVGVVTVVASPDAGMLVKLVVLAAFSLFGAVSCLWSRLPPLGARLIGVSLIAYAVYCVARIAGPLVLGPDSPLVEAALSTAPGSAVAALMVGLVAWGTVVVIQRGPETDESTIVTSDALSDWVGALLMQNPTVAAIAVSAPDLPLHRAAFGRAWATAVSQAINRAVRAAMPVGSVVGMAAPGVLVALQFGTAVDFDDLRTRIQDSYDRMLPRTAPTAAPDLQIEHLDITSDADIRRYARRARASARRAMAAQGV